MAKIKVCINGGCGHSGSVISGIAASGDTQVLCAYSGSDDDNLDSLRDRIAKAGLDAPYYEDFEYMLEKEKPDICVVDNVFHKHAKAAICSLSRGIATYCEKPLALDISSLEELSIVQAGSGALLWAMQSARYDPWFYTAHQLIKESIFSKHCR